ncbi:MAG: XdhC family protein [Verrucomicrobiota bacterium]
MHSTWAQIVDAYEAHPSKDYALVTLVTKKGSSYLQPGARLLVCENGQFWGEISAGCLETEVASQAISCLKRRQHNLFSFDTRPYYGCFGEITLLIEVIQDKAAFRALLHEVRDAREKRRDIQIITDYHELGPPTLTSRLSQDQPLRERNLVETLKPPFQLIVLGDWPDGKSIAELGNKVGWETSLYDASTPSSSLKEIFAGQKIDQETAVVLATHNLARDVSYLERVLRLNYGYIGVIGSKKRRQELTRRIADRGDFELIEKLHSIHCPAGLNLGGEGAQAIALSVVSEIQATLHKREAGSLLRQMPEVQSESVTSC